MWCYPCATPPTFCIIATTTPSHAPLIFVSTPGQFCFPELGVDLDVRSDVPQYYVYQKGVRTSSETDVRHLWRDDFVSFVLGCSFSFEQALLRGGFELRHISQGCNVPMFISTVPTVPAGRFSGSLVLSMRPYKRRDIPAVFDLCAAYPHAHGAPLYWGNAAAIGIESLSAPHFGDAVRLEKDEVPVFWACGVTPQRAIENARPDICITHAPGCMLITDLPADQAPQVQSCMRALQSYA